MKFFIIIAHDDTFIPTNDLTSKIVSWNKTVKKTGFLIDSNPLVPAEEGITIRIRNNKNEKRNGPFSDCNEQIAAYVLVDCISLDEAVAIAEKHPMASAATVEVRRVWEELSLI